MQISLPLKTTLALAVALLFSLLLTAPMVSAADTDAVDNLCSGANLSVSDETDCAGEEASESIDTIIQTVVNILSTVVGIVAVIFIIISGFKYVTSGGDSGKVGSAKSTIIYAIVGLVIVALAQIIVKFVISTSAGE